MLTQKSSIQNKDRLVIMNEVLKNKFLVLFSFLTFLILSINITATSVGVFSTYFNIPWGMLTIFTISILSLAFSCCFSRFFPFENYSKFLFFFATICLTAIVYGRFNAVIEIRQDPSIYAFNAFNLVNHGTLTKPLQALGELIEKGFYSFDEWKHYAKIFNGTQSLVTGKLYGDFFPGGTYVYAFLGSISKSYVFYGPTFVMISVCISLYFIIYKIINEAFSTFLLTSTFLLSPIMTWFGRAFYAGPFALLFFLLILFLLIDYFDFQTQPRKLILLILLFSLSYFSRLEMFMILLLAVFLISYQNWRFGLLMLAMAILVMVIADNNYPIYYNRIGNKRFTIIFVYWQYIVTATYFLAICFSYLMKKCDFSLEKFLSSRTIFYGLIVIFSLSALLILRNDYVDLFGQHQIKSMNGNSLRTFNEENLDRIFMVFPVHMFFIGIGYLAFVFRKQHISPHFRIVLVALLLPNLLFLYEIHNSPMLYWAIRRYIPVVLPAVFLGFIFFLKDLSYRQRMVLIVSSLLIMTNIFLEARQRRDYKGLNISVESFTKQFDEKDNYLFIYDKKLRYLISSMMSYGKYDFFPVNSVSEIPLISSNFPDNKKKKILFVSLEKFPIEHQKYTIEYQKVGENFHSLPKNYYREKHLLYFYDIELLATTANSLWKDGKLWPNLSVSQYSGFYGKGWTNGNARLENIEYKLQPKDSTITISRKRRIRVPYSSRADLGLRLLINGIEAEFQKEEREFKYIFLLPKNVKTIKTLEIITNTFIPKEYGYNKDGRKLGVYIDSIKID